MPRDPYSPRSVLNPEDFPTLAQIQAQQLKLRAEAEYAEDNPTNIDLNGKESAKEWKKVNADLRP